MTTPTDGMTTPTDRPNLDRLRELAPEIMSQQRDGVVALVAALTDVLALHGKNAEGRCDECLDGIEDGEYAWEVWPCSTVRAITNHVTPDALASETTETKG